jgi:hypothetical protein
MAPLYTVKYFTPYNKDQKSRYGKPQHEQKMNQSKEVTDLKSRELFRTIYPMNKSGSKQIIIGLDPCQNFAPTLLLCKSGWSGYRLSLEGWQTLLSSLDFITGYFMNTLQDGHETTLNLSMTEKITLRHQFNSKLISFSKTEDDSNGLTIAKPTWEGLLNIIPCINHTLNVFTNICGDVSRFFDALCTEITNQLPSNFTSLPPQANKMKIVQSILREIPFDAVPYQNTETSFDVYKCFYEMQAFCLLDISANLIV